jgi:hypothetical protein
MKKQLESTTPDTFGESSSGFQPINFGNVVLVFIILFIGIFISLVFLGMEYLKSYCSLKTI